MGKRAYSAKDLRKYHGGTAKEDVSECQNTKSLSTSWGNKNEKSKGPKGVYLK